MTADLEREALRQVGLRTLRELAEGAMSDEHRLAAACALVEFAVKSEWHEAAEQRQEAARAGENGRGRGWRL
jgi:hypothetical protein